MSTAKEPSSHHNLGTGLTGEPNAYMTKDDSLLGKGHRCASHNGTSISGWTCLDLVLGPQVQGALAVSLEDARVTLQLCPVSNWANTCRDGDAALTLGL